MKVNLNDAMRNCETWHTIAALLVHKTGLAEVVITEDDLLAFGASPNQAVLCWDRADGIHLMLITEDQAIALMQQEDEARVMPQNEREQ